MEQRGRRSSARMAMLKRMGQFWPRARQGRAQTETFETNENGDASRARVLSEGATPRETEKVEGQIVPAIGEGQQDEEDSESESSEAESENGSDQSNSDGEGSSSLLEGSVSNHLEPVQSLEELEEQTVEMCATKIESNENVELVIMHIDDTALVASSVDSTDKLDEDFGNTEEILPSEPETRVSESVTVNSEQLPTIADGKDNPMLGHFVMIDEGAVVSAKTDAAKLSATHSEVEKISQRQAELSSAVDDMLSNEEEEEGEGAVQNAVSDLLHGIYNDVQDVRESFAKTTLTPSQIALLYTTLQCSNILPPKRKQNRTPMPENLRADRFRGRPGQQNHATLSSEKLILSHAFHTRRVIANHSPPVAFSSASSLSYTSTGALTDNSRVMNRLYEQHEERIYPQENTSRKRKEVFWHRMATRIQSAWRGMQERDKFLQKLRLRRYTQVSTLDRFPATPISTALYPTSKVEMEAEPKRNAEQSVGQDEHRGLQNLFRVSELPHIPSEIPLTPSRATLPTGTKQDPDLAKQGGTVAPSSLNELDEDDEDGEETEETFDYVLGKSDHDILMRLFQTLRAANSDHELSLRSIVSILRRCRTHVSKTEFDILLDRVIKGLLRVPGVNPYKPLSLSEFVGKVVQKALGTVNNSLGEDVLELAYRIEAMSTRGLKLFLPLFNHTDAASEGATSERKARHSDHIANGDSPIDAARLLAPPAIDTGANLTAHEVKLLDRLFMSIARSERLLFERGVFVEAGQFLAVLKRLTGIHGKESSKLYSNIQYRGSIEGKLSSSDFIRVVQMHTQLSSKSVTSSSIVTKILQLAFRMDQEIKQRRSRKKQSAPLNQDGENDSSANTQPPSPRREKPTINIERRGSLDRARVPFMSRSVKENTDFGGRRFSPLMSLRAEARERAHSYNNEVEKHP